MKTIPLEKAKKLAASGDWMANKGTFYVGSLAKKTIDEFVGWCNQEDSFYKQNAGLPKGHPDKLSGDALGTKLQELQDRDRANAALLVHCRNHFDELIGALERAIELANMSDDEYERQPEKDPTKALDAVLMRAKTVEMS